MGQTDANITPSHKTTTRPHLAWSHHYMADCFSSCLSIEGFGARPEMGNLWMELAKSQQHTQAVLEQWRVHAKHIKVT